MRPKCTQSTPKAENESARRGFSVYSTNRAAVRLLDINEERSSGRHRSLREPDAGILSIVLPTLCCRCHRKVAGECEVPDLGWANRRCDAQNSLPTSYAYVFFLTGRVKTTARGGSVALMRHFSKRRDCV